MTEQEFIDILELTLRGEIPECEIQDNIQYYRNYIRSNRTNRTEQEIIQELGDPRLIARTICDTYQMNSKEHKYTNQASSQYRDYESDNSSKQNVFEGMKVKGMSERKLKLITLGIAIALILILLLILGALFWLSGVILKVFIRFIFPIIVIVIFVGWIRSKMRN